MKFKHQQLILFFIFIFSGCWYPSISEKDSSAGLNGGFEKIKFGLPLNWDIYDSDGYKKTYDLVYDTIDPKEGKQSLKFEIQKVDPSEKKFRKPGLSSWTEATSGCKYKVSFWVKNNSCEFKITVFCPGSKYPKPVVKTNESFKNWEYFEYEHIVPKQSKQINFEVNIFSPGEFWIDDIQIEKIEN